MHAGQFQSCTLLWFVCPEQLAGCISHVPEPDWLVPIVKSH